MKASEARKQWKDVLDRAAKGEVIQIERGGVVFWLKAVASFMSTPTGPNGFYELGKDPEKVNELYPKEDSSNIRPHIGIDPATVGLDETWETKDSGKTWVRKAPEKKSRLATPTTTEDKLAAMSAGERKEAERKKAEQDDIDSKLRKAQENKGYKFCKHGQVLGFCKKGCK